ncbi:hypothetical protein GOP47_0018745 [Adiantum capillus-veneris]|uniref:Uncharacterized protein n=1 Tax=Adiantum capillus-veneris TaxID=13818 RepID=A0A9D4UF78_ADICA|nr:hypothetical protein GOP47_0018745 [Adiantum capillus-veneris]
MQGRHETIIHSVKDPPSLCLVHKQSKLCSFHTYRACQHARHKRALTCRGLRHLHRRMGARRTEIICKKLLTEPSTPGSHKLVIPERGENLGLHVHGRIASRGPWDERIHSPSETDVIEETSPHFEQSTRLDHVLTAMARQQSKRSLSGSFIVVPPSRKGEMEAFKWLKSMSNVYGPSLILLVGLGYWIQGFRCFPWFAVNFYFKDVLTVDPGTLQIVQNTVNIPMVAKPVYGIVSDAVYIRGAHRVPYLVIGGFLQALSWGTIAFLPGGSSSISIVAILLALSNLGASMVDVANDALVAECAKMKKSTGKLMAVNEGTFGLRIPQAANEAIEKRIESEEMRSVKLLPSRRSRYERSQYALAFETAENSWRRSSIEAQRVSYANMNSAEEVGWRQSTGIEAISPDYTSVHRARSEALSVQSDPAKVGGMRQQFTELIDLVKKPEIFFPMSWFMASYAMIPTLAGTMFFFQTQHLKIDPSVVGMAKVMGQVGLMGGSALYSRYLKGMPLRKLLGSIQVLLCMCMMFDILLVKRMNLGLGIPDAVLVMGASAFVDAINQFKILPFMVLLAQLCPAGSEGSLLAAFMSAQCLATIISGYMGVSLASMLHITCDDFSELPTGIVVQAMAALLPLLWISFIPDESRSGNAQQDGKSSD